MTDSPTANEAIRLKSLIFWLDQVQRTDELAMVRRYWTKKDFKGYREAFPVCPRCHGSPAFDLTASGEPVILHGILIERVQCYCLTLEFLSRTASRWYESYYADTYLDDLKEIDVPAGAAARTKSIKGKIGKFLLNPTGSALINGGTGTGKTHILQSIKTAFGGFVVYITLGDFFSKLQSTREANNGSLQKFINALTYAPVLCLDDFGLGHQTDWSTNTLSSIIDSRYARRRLAPTIMTTNLTLAEMQQVEGMSIGNLERTVSRMMDADNSKVMTMLQKDFRQKLTRKEAAL